MDPAMAIEAAALAKQKPMLDALAQGDSDVQRFYKNSVIFITGGSGFLGKQLIEKLLRCCQPSKVFVLIRSKKGKNISERMQKLLVDPVFYTLRKEQPNFCNKITAIEGDVAEIRLGINDDNWKILTEQVEVIFHVAATTRFDEALHIATLINVRGAREAILLGKSCTKLRSYVHVSTAYSHTTPDLTGCEIHEEFYKTPAPPEAIISLAENMDSTTIDKITNDLINKWPNTYTFTKALAEELVRTTSVGLPICIVRPAIVMPTYCEPSPGWLDRSCVYGAAGLFMGICAGVLNVMLVDINMLLGYIPCDYVNNAIVVAAKETSTNQAKGGNDTTIYTISSTKRNATSIHLLYGVLDKQARYLASPKAVYYSGTITTANKSLFSFLSFLLHTVPAYLVDFVCALMGKQIRFATMAKKLCNMIYKMSYFTLNEWIFDDKNLEKLYEGLSEQDKAIFNFHIPGMDWTEYAHVTYIGLRKYIFKDGLKNTKYGNRKQICFKIVNYLIITLCGYGLWKLFNIMFYLGTVLFTALVK